MAKTALSVKESGKKIKEVLQKALYCHVAFADGQQPYVIPLSFGVLDGYLYFHAGLEGKKLRLLRDNPRVSFAIEHAVALQEAKKACKFSMSYASVVGNGMAMILQDLQEKSFGLNVVVQHYGAEPEEYTANALQGLSVVKIEILEISYKEAHL